MDRMPYKDNVYTAERGGTRGTCPPEVKRAIQCPPKVPKVVLTLV